MQDDDGGGVCQIEIKKTIKSLAFLLKAQSSTWHHSSAPAHLLFLRKDETLVRIAAKQLHSASTWFLSTSQSHACQPALQLQEWDLQDITIRKRGGEAPSVPVGRSIRMAATTPSPSLCSYGGGPASSTPTSHPPHRLVPVGEGHNAFICCKGGPGCQSPTSLSLQFLGLLRSHQSSRRNDQSRLS